MEKYCELSLIAILFGLILRHFGLTYTILLNVENSFTKQLTIVEYGVKHLYQAREMLLVAQHAQ